jgi:hypothetical protein
MMSDGASARARLEQAERDRDAFHALFVGRCERFRAIGEEAGLLMYDRRPEAKLIDGEVVLEGESRAIFVFDQAALKWEWFERAAVNVDGLSSDSFRSNRDEYRYEKIEYHETRADYFLFFEDVDDHVMKYKYSCNNGQSVASGTCDDAGMDAAFRTFLDLVDVKTRFIRNSKAADLAEEAAAEQARKDQEIARLRSQADQMIKTSVANKGEQESLFTIIFLLVLVGCAVFFLL